MMTTEELSKASGATLRQLQWWDEQGIVSPSITEHSRNYTPEQARAVFMVTELRRSGVGLRVAGKAARMLEKRSDAEWLLIDPAGKIIQFTQDPTDVAAIAAKAPMSVVVVKLRRDAASLGRAASAAKRKLQ